MVYWTSHFSSLRPHWLRSLQLVPLLAMQGSMGISPSNTSGCLTPPLPCHSSCLTSQYSTLSLLRDIMGWPSRMVFQGPVLFLDAMLWVSSMAPLWPPIHSYQQPLWLWVVHGPSRPIWCPHALCSTPAIPHHLCGCHWAAAWNCGAFRSMAASLPHIHWWWRSSWPQCAFESLGWSIWAYGHHRCWAHHYFFTLQSSVSPK